MSETPRPSYVEYGEHEKKSLSKSWDAESRFRLQENALSLPTGEDDTALFRVKVELGLHELTAALTSLSRRIDKLEENTAPPDTEKQDEAVKELARSARCLSQALPGIASARTRRRALHGYFREGDEKRGGYGDRNDPAARALVIEGLACLAGKVRVETARGKANGGGVWSSTTRATRGLSPSPRRQKQSTHSSVGETGVASEEEKMLQGVISRDGGDGDTRMLAPASERDFSSLRTLALPKGFAPEGEFAPGRLEVEHLRGSLEPSLPPSPITLTGSTNYRMLPPAPKKTKDRSLRAESKVGRWAESARLTEPNEGKPRNEANPSASGGSNGGAGGGSSSNSLSSSSNSLSSSSAVQDDSSSRAINGASGNSSALGATSDSRSEKGRPTEGERSNYPSVARVAASERTADNGDDRNKYTTQLMNMTSAATGSSRGTPGEAGSASDRDVMVRMLLNAAGAAAEAEERVEGPGAQGDGQGFTRRGLRRWFDSDGGGSRGGGSIQVRQEDLDDFRREVDVVRALSSHLRGSASSTSSSLSASSSSWRAATGAVNAVTAAAPAAVVQRTKASEVPKDKSGGSFSPEGVSLDALEIARPQNQRSLLDAEGGKKTPLVDGERRSSFSCRDKVSLERDGRARLVDAQGFFDLGAAGTCREDSAGLAGLEGKQSEGPYPEISDRGVAELEAKLEDLRKIGDRIKDEAAATMEPSVTIPTQDFCESGSPFPPSRHPHHHQQTSRSGRTRGSKLVGAATGSAFTSAESSPCRSEVDLLSSAVPPPRPGDHQGTEPALSKLLAPPFNNVALRGEFIASLEQHLAQYEDCTRHTVEDDATGKAVGDGHAKVDDMVAACDGDGDQACRNGSRDRSDDTCTSFLGTITSVREIPSSSVASETRSKQPVRAAPKEVEEAENATPNATGATSGVSREDTDGLVEGEGHHEKTPIEETTAGMEAKTSINWAQEYHDYLCSKDP